MGHHILLAHIEQHPVTTQSELLNIYTYFKFKAYLQTTLRCTRKAYCIKAMKTANAVNTMPPEELYALADAGESNVGSETRIDLEWAIEQLNPVQREVIKLYYFRGRTDLEISEQRNVSRQAVNNLKRRALSNLKYIISAGD